MWTKFWKKINWFWLCPRRSRPGRSPLSAAWATVWRTPCTHPHIPLRGRCPRGLEGNCPEVSHGAAGRTGCGKEWRVMMFGWMLPDGLKTLVLDVLFFLNSASYTQVCLDCRNLTSWCLLRGNQWTLPCAALPGLLNWEQRFVQWCTFVSTLTWLPPAPLGAPRTEGLNL